MVFIYFAKTLEETTPTHCILQFVLIIQFMCTHIYEGTPYGKSDY